MKTIRLLITCVCIFLSLLLWSQGKPKTAEQLKQEMAQIRRSTNWSNAAEADSAQLKIEALSKQLMVVNKINRQQAAGQSVDSAKIQDEAEYKMSLWHQMMIGVGQGESGERLLAQPLREKIVEAYKNDESPKVKNPEYFEEQTYLCIDMSLPTIGRIIEQMENFKSIKILLITCSSNKAAVDLDDIFKRAKAYPLQQLHIINFNQYVSSIPSSVGRFTKLQILSLYNNNLNELPDALSQLTSLEKLYVDINPIQTLMPQISTLSNLDTLGVAKTNIPENEIEQIRTMLPHCKILVK